MIITAVIALFVPIVISPFLKNKSGEQVLENKIKELEKQPDLILKRSNGYRDNFYVINIKGCQYLIADASGGYITVPVHLANCTNCFKTHIALEKGEKQ